MPQYFFHIRAGEDLDRDEFGVDLPDLDSVRSEARRAVAGFMFDAAMDGQPLPGQSFEIVDGKGTCVLILPFDRVWDGTSQRGA